MKKVTPIYKTVISIDKKTKEKTSKEVIKSKIDKDLMRDLDKAISNFNKKLNELQIDGTREYLPEKLSYKETKQRIKTREELRRVIRSLQDFTKQGQEDLIQLESGEGITKWEKNKLHFENQRAQERIKQEIAEYHKPLADSGFTRAQMGSTELNKLESKLEYLESINKKKGEAFKNLKKRISFLGSIDFEYRKAWQYRKKYMETIINHFQNFDGYDELKKAFNNHKNVFDFYEWIKSTDNVNIIDIHYESSHTFTQQQFYKFLEDLGIEYDKKNETVEKEN